MRPFRTRETESRTTISGLWKRRVDNVQILATSVTEKDSPASGAAMSLCRCGMIICRTCRSIRIFPSPIKRLLPKNSGKPDISLTGRDLDLETA